MLACDDDLRAIRQLLHRTDDESIWLRQAKAVGVVLGEGGGQFFHDFQDAFGRRWHSPIESLKDDVRAIERDPLDLPVLRLQEIGLVSERADRKDGQALVLAVDVQQLGPVALRLRRIEPGREQTVLRRHEVDLNEIRMKLLDLEGAVPRWVMLPEAERHQLASTCAHHSPVSSLCIRPRFWRVSRSISASMPLSSA